MLPAARIFALQDTRIDRGCMSGLLLYGVAPVDNISSAEDMTTMALGLPSLSPHTSP